MDKIVLKDKTKETVRELIRTINELQGRLQLILTIILNENEKDVQRYMLNDDLDLVEIEENGEPISIKGRNNGS